MKKTRLEPTSGNYSSVPDGYVPREVERVNRLVKKHGITMPQMPSRRIPAQEIPDFLNQHGAMGAFVRNATWEIPIK